MKNWKTTAAGFAAGIVFVVTGQPDWRHILVAIALAVAGLVQKDSNVTGGTVGQNGGTVPANPILAVKPQVVQP